MACRWLEQASADVRGGLGILPRGPGPPSCGPSPARSPRAACRFPVRPAACLRSSSSASAAANLELDRVGQQLGQHLALLDAVAFVERKLDDAAIHRAADRSLSCDGITVPTNAWPAATSRSTTGETDNAADPCGGTRQQLGGHQSTNGESKNDATLFTMLPPSALISICWRVACKTSSGFSIVTWARLW